MKPFDNLTDFEAFRSLALADPGAASSQLALQAHISTNTLVRIYFGPPGTGKTLMAVQQAVKVVDPGFADQDDFSACFRRMNELHDQIAFVTFHPSLQYEDVVESIRPRLIGGDQIGGSDGDPEASGSGEDTSVGYTRFDGPLMRLAVRAIRHSNQQYVVVIDEINRGDVSRILGPMISALEADKRIGADFPIGFERQYPDNLDGDTRMFLPGNLHILGTMNSADRNIALVDYALRRRFDFVSCPPDPGLLAQTVDEAPLNLRELLQVINGRIAFLLDDDHRIGHGYLMGVNTNAEAVRAFAQKILPLLSEYFYGDEGLIALVLGDRIGGAFNVMAIEPATHNFATLFDMTQDDAGQYGMRPGRAHLALNVDPRFWNTERMPPGPDNDGYAVSALRKLYESKATNTTLSESDIAVESEHID